MMENQNTMQFAKEVVTEEIRKGNLVKSKEVFAMLPELMDTVRIDQNKMRGSIEPCFSAANPLNAVLKRFGLQLIRTEKTITRLLHSGSEPKDASDQAEDSYAKRWLTLNPKEFRAVVEKIAQKLLELETQANQAYDDEKMRGDELFGKYEKLLKEYNELKCSSETNEKLIAERIQYMLSRNGQDSASDNEQFIELFKDLNIEVYWDSANAPFADAAMFTEYVVDDEALAGTKPCLICSDKVFVKGIRLIKK